MLTRFPWDNLGIAVLTNDNPYISEVIKYRLIDEALALEPIDWNERSVSII